ncbi:MAG: tryptophan synthase subunit alpha [Acidobacteria bacterium]|nr:tryptophan synthase subunit alpha [Acidobacteriota bacterium]
MSGRLERAFERARAENRACLIIFVEASDPDSETTARMIPALGEAGADIVELGVPFSDPIADGPVIQRASERALLQGGGLRPSLSILKKVRSEGCEVPVVLFGYVNPVLAMGEDAFISEAREAGADGVLFTDLPPEEGAGLCRGLIREGLAPVNLLAPTSTEARIQKAVSITRGFLYLVSRPGVTGERKDLPAELPDLVARVKKVAGRLPVAVGFGIATPEHVRQAARLADGVVVGSVVVRCCEEAVLSGKDPVSEVTGLVRSLAGGLAR